MSYLDTVLSLEGNLPNLENGKHVTLVVDKGFDIVDRIPELILSLESNGIEYSIVDDVQYVYVKDGSSLSKMNSDGDVNAVDDGVYRPELDTNVPRDFRTIRIVTDKSKNKHLPGVDVTYGIDTGELSLESSAYDVEGLYTQLGW